MFKQLSFLFLLLSMLTAQVVAAPYLKLVQREETAEVTGLKITLNSDLNGKIILQECSKCTKIIVTITPETKAFKNEKAVPLIEAKKLVGKSALVSYNIESKLVTRIGW